MYLLPCLQLILPFQGGLINLRSCWRVMNRRKRAGPRLLIIRATYIAWRGEGTGINQCFESPDNWCSNLRIWVLFLAKVFNFYHLAGLFPIFTWGRHSRQAFILAKGAGRTERHPSLTWCAPRALSFPPVSPRWIKNDRHFWRGQGSVHKRTV